MSYNILIVDDSKTVIKMMEKTLAMIGLPLKQIYTAENGRQALDLLEKQWIDLVLTDINMPVMNGMEMVAIMAEKGLLQEVPVVVISTEGSDERINQLKEQGIRGYLRKPITPEDVKSLMASILGVQI